MKHLLVCLLLTAGIFYSCDKTETVEPFPELMGSDLEFQSSLIDYGLNSFQNVVSEGDDNVLISPLSLSTALYMTMTGTGGETVEDFRTALKLDKFYPDEVDEKYKALAERLIPKNEGTELGNHNSVFHYPLLVSLDEGFDARVVDNYNAEVISADFSQPSTLDQINDWVNEKTSGRIEKILNEIRSDEAIFLINALFFKSDWKQGFLPILTQEKPFTKMDGTVIDVSMMSSDDQRSHYIGDDFSAMDLMFIDDEYSMTFIRPNTETVNDFVLGFNDTEFLDFYLDLYDNKLSEGRLQTFLPKFEIASKKNMADILKEMGMTTVFDSADLTRMGEFAGNTYLTRVLHDTFLKIDEKGAEGAAVTAVGVGVESVPPTIDFNVPFLFILRHVESNTPIFIGKCGNPQE